MVLTDQEAVSLYNVLEKQQQTILELEEKLEKTCL
jgi:hypothetical protein